MSDNLPYVAVLTAEARTLAKAYVGVGHRHGVENLLTRLAESLESLSARGARAETELAQAKHDVWERGATDAVDIRISGAGYAAVAVSPRPANPFPAPVSGIADQKDRNEVGE